MPSSLASRRDRTRVCTNAVVSADNQGIASLLDRLDRLLRKQAYGHQAMGALHASIEPAIRDLSRPPIGKTTEIHAWFTIGARGIEVRLENGVANGQKAASTPSSQVPPPEMVAGAAACALRLIRYRADNWSVSMLWRRIPSEHVPDLSLE